MQKLIDTLIELERLKRLDRTGWTLRGLPNGTESVASHSFGVGVTAMLLADELIARGITVNIERVLRMALMHDWAEARTGDMPKVAKDYFSSDAVRHAEGRAFDDIVDGCSQASLYRSVYQSYESRDSFEARLVKVSDVVDLIVEALALERAGARGLDEFWQVAEQNHFEFEPPVQQVIEELFVTLLKIRTSSSDT